ncbi:rRNA pseudouridine synthase [Streptomyces sp. NBC_01728]|uniref:pseudouridine synthase n=1 Tax=unclassified Streptomyces TaxID=2593676 RepID=UPI0022591BA2|nr:MULTISPECIES: pseudouridine synthase [unclassified Streptomyces]MCX4453123.1 rRNA pseudouridine synthase [Streptomyces sp. NBC_01719]MCX4492483.1 rRNA pseudouridine synthase [Streptomyces sp. NBC_01728]
MRSSGSGSGRNSGRGNPRGTGGGSSPRGTGGGSSPRGTGGGGNPRGSGGGGNPRGSGGSGSQPRSAGGRDDRPKRPSKPRPEERRYDVGPGASPDGPKSGRGNAARGGAKGGPKQGQQRGGRTEPSRSREYETRTEERNRDRYAGKPDVKLPKTFPGAEQEGERLQKVLARAGYGSRRSCEELIEQARVEVNGEIVLEQGLRVDPEHDEIKVDGLTVATQSYQFFSLNKPAGVVSTMEDPEGRQCLGDYVTNRETRLFHVGRLDTETEGVILLTNHGELAHRLTHPKYGVKKTYLAHIVGPIPRDLGKQLKDGIQLEDGYAKADHFRVVEQTGKNYLVEVTLHEGRKHIVRRMLAEAGFPVDKLVRVSFGPITLGDQKSGWLRRLSNTEVGMLMQEVDL